MKKYDSIAYQRNFGFWSKREQELLSKSKVAIAGVGGDGFQLGYKLAMMGVVNFSIADPETFELENSNRVIGATSSNIGKNKAKVFRDMVLGMRPDAKIDLYTDGVNEDNVKKFMHGADLVLDESELTRLEIGTMIAREARRIGIPDLMVMNIGFASIATSFHPESKNTFEKIMGIPKDMPLSEIIGMKINLSRCLPYVPGYGDLNTFIAVNEGAHLPSISQGVDVASAIGSTEAFLHLTSKCQNHRRTPTWAPKFRFMDCYTGKGGTVRMPVMSFYLGFIKASILFKMGRNPVASYKKFD